MGQPAGAHAAGPATERRAERALNTFVVRRWQAASGEARYAVTHTQSGRHTQAAGDAAAAAWIGEFGPGETSPAEHPVVAPTR